MVKVSRMSRRKTPKIKDVWDIRKNICRTEAFLEYFNDAYRPPYPENKRLDCNSLGTKFMTDSGKRTISPFLEMWYEEFDGDLKDSQNCNDIALVIIELYRDKWDKLYDIYKIKYDPIHNYLDEWSDNKDFDSDRLETDNLTRTDVIDSTTTLDKTRTDNLAENSSGTSSESSTNSTTDGKWGFNVSSAEGSRPTDTSSSSTSTNSQDSRETLNTGTQEVDSNESTNANNVRTNTGTVSNKDKEYTERSGIHSGNIGNLTSQKQINEEIALWQWQFIDEVVKDLISLLTLPIYID